MFWKGTVSLGTDCWQNHLLRGRSIAVHHYGHDVVQKRYASLAGLSSAPFLLEHGVNFNGNPPLKNSIIGSDMFLLGQGVHLCCNNVTGLEGVGPYIRYAGPWDQERLALRRQLGQVLLLIPPHSTAQLQRSGLNMVGSMLLSRIGGANVSM